MFQHGGLVLPVERSLDDLDAFLLLLGNIRGEAIEQEPLVGPRPQLWVLLLHEPSSQATIRTRKRGDSRRCLKQHVPQYLVYVAVADGPSFHGQNNSLWPSEPRIAATEFLVVLRDEVCAPYLKDQDRVVVGLVPQKPVLEEREENLVNAVAVQSAAVPVKRVHPDPQGMAAFPPGLHATVPLGVDPVLDAQGGRYLMQLSSVLESEDQVALIAVPVFVRRLRDKRTVFGRPPRAFCSASA